MSERKLREKIVRPNADEQYLLFRAAKKLLESGRVTNFTEYPSEIMQTIDVIRPIALSGFLIHQVYPANYHKIYADPDYREPEIIKPSCSPFSVTYRVLLKRLQIWTMKQIITV